MCGAVARSRDRGGDDRSRCKAEGLDFLDGMGDENVHEFVAAESGERERAELLEREASGMVGASGPQIRAAFGDLLSGVDQAALTGTFAEYLAEAITLGLRDGIWGWIDDDMAFMRDWGFDLQAIASPVTIWQGGQDRMVPYAHGRWLAAHVRGASRLLPEQGHLTLVLEMYGRILDELIASGG
jgi:pimeloyl-ACP methyl ester carboxylesterase